MGGRRPRPREETANGTNHTNKAFSYRFHFGIAYLWVAASRPQALAMVSSNPQQTIAKLRLTLPPPPSCYEELNRNRYHWTYEPRLLRRQFISPIRPICSIGPIL